jgi:hypothetical protein
MPTLTEQLGALADEEAVAALALVLQRQGQVVDPFAWQQDEAKLRQALAQPDLAQLASPAPDVRPGQVARIVLAYLAEQDQATRGLVEHAVTVPPRPDRFDPATLAVGALVLLAFHAEIKLERDPERGWSFRFHTRPLKDSVIGRLLGQLMGVYQDPTR